MSENEALPPLPILIAQIFEFQLIPAWLLPLFALAAAEFADAVP
jgi:hypothetical protein